MVVGLCGRRWMAAKDALNSPAGYYPPEAQEFVLASDITGANSTPTISLLFPRYFTSESQNKSIHLRFMFLILSPQVILIVRSPTPTLLENPALTHGFSARQ